MSSTVDVAVVEPMHPTAGCKVTDHAFNAELVGRLQG